MEKEIEIWKDVPGYEGKYQVNNLGDVKTLTREIVEHRRKYIRQGKILNKYFSKSEGYYKVKLYNGDATFASYPVHRLVAMVFIPNPENKLQVNHIDGNPSNNHYKNLEWCTHSENVKHAYRIGLKKKENYVGEASKLSKLSAKEVIAIREEYATGTTSYSKLAKKYNTIMGNISFIVNKQTWKHV